MAMTDCETFELWIEMRLHGALASSEGLDAHLVVCPQCRSFEALAKSTEQTMTNTAAVETSQVDWQALKNAISARLSRDTKVRIGAVVGVLVTQAVAMVTFDANHHGRLARVLTSFGGMAAVVLAIVTATALARRWRLRAYQDSREDLLFFQRSYLEGRLWRTSLAALLLVPLGLSYVAVRITRHVDLTEWLGASLMTATWLGIAGYLFFVQRPRLLREIAAFKQRR
jgi:hypothetical protein